MRARLKILIITALALLAVAAIAGLSLRYSGTALHGQNTLKQAQAGLRVWRGCLYTVITGLWLSVHQRLRQHTPELLPAIKRLAYWSIALLMLGEISNTLLAQTAG